MRLSAPLILIQLLLGAYLLLGQVNSGCIQGMDCTVAAMPCCLVAADGTQQTQSCAVSCQVFTSPVFAMTGPMVLRRALMEIRVVTQLNNWTDPPGLPPPRLLMI